MLSISYRRNEVDDAIAVDVWTPAEPVSHP
jgi:hypothetical protein